MENENNKKGCPPLRSNNYLARARDWKIEGPIELGNVILDDLFLKIQKVIKVFFYALRR